MPNLSDVLSGVTVLDLSRNLGGPYCTMLLGDLGAEVVKVESLSGDDTRRWRPPAWGDESATFLACNRNKRSLALDLDAEGGRDIVTRLALDADVVVSSFRPGSLAKRGLDYESLVSVDPGLRLLLHLGLRDRVAPSRLPRLRPSPAGRERDHVRHGASGRPAGPPRRRCHRLGHGAVGDHRHPGCATHARRDGHRDADRSQPLRDGGLVALVPHCRLYGVR